MRLLSLPLMRVVPPSCSDSRQGSNYSERGPTRQVLWFPPHTCLLHSVATTELLEQCTCGTGSVTSIALSERAPPLGGGPRMTQFS